jgi:hypothetical protein
MKEYPQYGFGVKQKNHLIFTINPHFIDAPLAEESNLYEI